MNKSQRTRKFVRCRTVEGKRENEGEIERKVEGKRKNLIYD